LIQGTNLIELAKQERSIRCKRDKHKHKLAQVIRDFRAIVEISTIWENTNQNEE